MTASAVNASPVLVNHFDRILVGAAPLPPAKVKAETIYKKVREIALRVFEIISFYIQRVAALITRTSIAIKSTASQASYTLSYCLQNLEKHFKTSLVEPYYILTLDGGGIRGIIPIEVLKVVEAELGAPITAAFDEIWGTSTGGIISLAISLPSDQDPTKPKYSAEDVGELYKTMAPKIFTNTLAYRIESGYGVFGSKYPNPTAPLRDIVGDVQLKDLVAKKVVVTSLDIISEKIGLFTNKAEELQQDAQLFLADNDIETITLPSTTSVCTATQATSAAPTYFDSVPLHSETDGDLNLIDGGVALNNPAQLAAFLALKNVDKNRPIVIISLGTGTPKTPPVQVKGALNWGWAQWGAPINEYFLDAAEVVANEQLKSLAESNPERFSFIRFQPKLETVEEAELDNITPSNILNLQNLAQKTFMDFLDNQGGRESIIDPLKRKVRKI